MIQRYCSTRLIPLIFMMFVAGFAYGVSPHQVGTNAFPPDTTLQVPKALIITREGKLPPPAIERSFLLSELGKDSIKKVFQAPPCLEGNYYVAFQLQYDLGDRKTLAGWRAALDIRLLRNADTLWTQPVGVNMTDQTFISTVFHDTLVSCDDNYQFSDPGQSPAGSGSGR